MQQFVCTLMLTFAIPSINSIGAIFAKRIDNAAFHKTFMIGNKDFPVFAQSKHVTFKIFPAHERKF